MDNSSRENKRKEYRDRIIGLGEKSVKKSYYPQLQQRLAELERFRTLLDKSTDYIFLAEYPSGVIVDVNESASTDMGLLRQDLMERNICDLFGQEHCSRILETASQNVTSQHPSPLEVPLTGKEGSELLVEVTAQIASLQDKKYIILVARNTTDRSLMRQEKERLQEQLRMAQKLEAIGQLAGGVAHDFNNLLTAIQGNAQLIQMLGTPDSREVEFATQIVNSSRQAANLTRQLLAFARKGKMQSIPTDVHDVIHEVRSLLSHSIDRRIEVVLNLTAPHPIIIGDPTELQSAFLNLGVNARDAMPEGGTMTFSTRSLYLNENYCQRHPYQLDPGEYLEVSVTDTGLGMEKETITRIFEPFFTTKGRTKGTGLGLASVYGCIKSHKGSINVYSEPGHGTTFRIFLPLAEQSAEPIQREKAMKLLRGTGSILIVDDEQSIREFASSVLTNLGYSVSLCADGLEALEYYRANHENIDLIVLDLIMPKLSGADTFSKLKEVNPDVRVVISSGFVQHELCQSVLGQGAKAFLSKPFNIEELSHTVAKYIHA